jgi:Protein of unknown function (DUF2934)
MLSTRDTVIEPGVRGQSAHGAQDTFSVLNKRCPEIQGPAISTTQFNYAVRLRHSTTKGKGPGMKSKSKRDEMLEIRAEPPQNHAPNPDKIRQRAYELYLEGGGLPGRELDDWLRAEREIEKSALLRQKWEGRQRQRRPDSGDGN